jgi:redox-sensitive bicupin YhaK (pirin superfamily)
MLRFRRAADRGHFDHGWLRTAHTFSFADYHDPQHMGFGPLRVINEDHVAPLHGFPLHPHRDMEILTWILAGELTHEDSMGHRQTLRRGEAQVMTAGRGVSHSEHNRHETAACHLLQIWLLPDRAGLTPRYDQQEVPMSKASNAWFALAGPRDRFEESLVQWHQDAWLHLALLEPQASLDWQNAAERRSWLQVCSGSLEIDGQTVAAGDGIACAESSRLQIRALEPAELLRFDLP